MLRKLALPSGFALLLAGCQAPSAPPLQQIPPHNAPVAACGSGEIMMQTTLWLTMTRADGAPVSASAWQQFEAQEVAPQFAGRYTLYQGMAQHETRKALVIVHPPDRASSERIDTLRVLYQRRFAQPDVMRVDTLVCGSLRAIAQGQDSRA